MHLLIYRYLDYNQLSGDTMWLNAYSATLRIFIISENKGISGQLGSSNFAGILGCDVQGTSICGPVPLSCGEVPKCNFPPKPIPTPTPTPTHTPQSTRSAIVAAPSAFVPAPSASVPALPAISARPSPAKQSFVVGEAMPGYTQHPVIVAILAMLL
jgi:hypothetical protein